MLPCFLSLLSFYILICFKVNGEKICIVKVPKRNLDELSKEQALDMSLGQKLIREELDDRAVLGSTYFSHENYDSVINIKTNFIKKDKVNVKSKKRKVKN